MARGCTHSDTTQHTQARAYSVIHSLILVLLCRTRSTRTQQCTLTLHVCPQPSSGFLLSGSCVARLRAFVFPASRSVRWSGTAPHGYLQEVATLPAELPLDVVSDQTCADEFGIFLVGVKVFGWDRSTIARYSINSVTECEYASFVRTSDIDGWHSASGEVFSQIP